MSLHSQVYDLLLKRLRDTGTLIENGHFLYRSGKHGDTYVDHWRLLQDTKTLHDFSQSLAERFTEPEDAIDAVVGLERGGGYVAMWLAYHLSCMKGKNIPWFFVSKNEAENFHYIDAEFSKQLEDKRILLADDVVNTGSRLKETIDLLREVNGWPVGIAALINRGSVHQSYFPFVQKFFSLLSLPLASWEPEECPKCKKGVPIDQKHGHGRHIIQKADPLLASMLERGESPVSSNECLS